MINESACPERGRDRSRPMDGSATIFAGQAKCREMR
ncbi:uncharacterized protein METZ01_LOCUS179030, partial [marine metagenome]